MKSDPTGDFLGDRSLGSFRFSFPEHRKDSELSLSSVSNFSHSWGLDHFGGRHKVWELLGPSTQEVRFEVCQSVSNWPQDVFMKVSLLHPFHTPQRGSVKMPGRRLLKCLLILYRGMIKKGYRHPFWLVSDMAGLGSNSVSTKVTGD